MSGTGWRATGCWQNGPVSLPAFSHGILDASRLGLQKTTWNGSRDWTFRPSRCTPWIDVATKRDIASKPRCELFSKPPLQICYGGDAGNVAPPIHPSVTIQLRFEVCGKLPLSKTGLGEPAAFLSSPLEIILGTSLPVGYCLQQLEGPET
ncbi:hypothetical protein MKZ38_009386 [Zalerion maritima]|uniref:Uncharacterized protein n=1 Tax=Zalerion maritima TaxID=339359 RepID=A0AAD5RGK8_9PEZI|nr:hypothetical protein MKZ38_009386 [Zalerion maritima]